MPARHFGSLHDAPNRTSLRLVHSGSTSTAETASPTLIKRKPLVQSLILFMLLVYLGLYLLTVVTAFIVIGHWTRHSHPTTGADMPTASSLSPSSTD